MEAEPRKRRRRFSEEERQQLIAAWRKSGQSAATFAQQNGMNASNLWRWASELERVGPQGQTNAAPASFVEVQVSRASEAGGGGEPSPHFQIEGPFGLRVRVYPGADVETLTRLLAALPGSGRC
jgi:transposase-like protein